MDIRKFAREVTKLEGKKKQVDIAQVMETLACADKLTDGLLYKLIKWGKNN